MGVQESSREIPGNQWRKESKTGCAEDGETVSLCPTPRQHSFEPREIHLAYKFSRGGR